MAVTLNYGFLAEILETLASGVDGAASPIIRHSSFDDTVQLTSSTTPPVTKCVCKVGALSAGAATLDLTTITGTNGLAQDMSTLKVQLFRIKNLSSTNNMTISEGASNGYELMGNAFTFVLKPSQQLMFFGNDSTPDVGGSAKTIDISGTGTDTYELTIVAG